MSKKPPARKSDSEGAKKQRALAKKYEEEQEKAQEKIRREKMGLEKELNKDLTNDKGYIAFSEDFDEIQSQIYDWERKKAKNKAEREAQASEVEKIIDENLSKIGSKYGEVFLPEDIKETIEDIKGNESTKSFLEDFFAALLNYNKYAFVLNEENLAPNLTALLYGPPGTGKTALTLAFAKKHNIPIAVIQSDSLVSGLLGDTLKNIAKVFEGATKIAERLGSFILFFDEIDAIGSERSNIHEVGEIKRAVITLLQKLDKASYKGVPLAVIAATNHEQQLDTAVWRRFNYHFKFEFPDYQLRKQIIEVFVNKLNRIKHKLPNFKVDESILKDLNEECKEIRKIQKSFDYRTGTSTSEFDEHGFWSEVEKEEDAEGLLRITHGYSGSDIQRGTRVTILKVLRMGELSYDVFFDSLKSVGGTAEHLGTNHATLKKLLDKVEDN